MFHLAFTTGMDVSHLGRVFRGCIGVGMESWGGCLPRGDGNLGDERRVKLSSSSFGADYQIGN